MKGKGPDWDRYRKTPTYGFTKREKVLKRPALIVLREEEDGLITKRKRGLQKLGRAWPILGGWLGKK